MMIMRKHSANRFFVIRCVLGFSNFSITSRFALGLLLHGSLIVLFNAWLVSQSMLLATCWRGGEAKASDKVGVLNV